MITTAHSAEETAGEGANEMEGLIELFHMHLSRIVVA